MPMRDLARGDGAAKVTLRPVSERASTPCRAGGTESTSESPDSFGKLISAEMRWDAGLVDVAADGGRSERLLIVRIGTLKRYCHLHSWQEKEGTS